MVDIRVGADGLVYSSSGKAVRKQYNNLKSMIRDQKENAVISTLLNAGIGNGVITAPTNERVVTQDLSPIDKTIEIRVNTGFKYTVVFYNDDASSSHSWGWHTVNKKITEMEYLHNFTKFRIVYAKENNAPITFDEAVDNIQVLKSVTIKPSVKTVNEQTLDDTLIAVSYTHLTLPTMAVV